MGARAKLNRLHLAGDFVLACVLGLFMQSWLALFLTLAVLIGLDLSTGDVRPEMHGRCGNRQRRGHARKEGGEA